MKIFLLLLLALFVYGVIQTIIQTQNDINEVILLINARTALWGIIVPFSYHTILALLKEKHKSRKYILFFLYAFGFVLIVLSLSGYNLFEHHFQAKWGWSSVLNFSSWFLWAFLAYLVSGVTVFISTLISIRNNTENYRQQKLAEALLLNLVWGSVFTVLLYTILAVFNAPVEIFLAYAGNLAQFLMVYAVQKYHPDNFSVDRIISSLNPLVPSDSLLVNPDNKILWNSKKDLLSNGITRKIFNGEDYTKLFMNVSQVNDEMEKIRNSEKYSSTIKTQLNTIKGESSIQTITISGIRNEFSEVIAFLIVFQKDNTDMPLLEHLQQSYDLSNREKEVAALLICEYSYTQICDRLFISLNTVKTHTRKIYQKTNTANRTEFNRFCRNLENQTG